MMQRKIYKFLAIIIALFWLLFFIYNYLIRVRIPYILAPTDYKLIIFLNGLVIIFNYTYLLRYTNIRHINKINNLLKKCEEILYWNSINFVFDKYFKHIPGVGDILMFLGNLIINIYNKIYKINKHVGLFICLIINTLPRLILLIAFCMDVFILNQFYYLFKMIPILVPYIFITRVILFVLRDFSIHNKEILDQILEITELGSSNYKVKLKPNKNYYQNDFDLHCKRYFLFKHLVIVTGVIIYCRDELMKPILNPIFIGIYFVGGLKILLVFSNIFLSYYFYIFYFIFVFVIELFNEKTIRKVKSLF